MQYSSTNLFVSLSSNDNCFYIEESVCLIKNILCSFDMTFLVVSKFKKKKEFLTTPFNLSLLNIYCVSELAKDIFVYPVNDIKCKFILLPHPTHCNYSVTVPLLHNES